MSYEPTVWHAGDKVTAAKLNKLENGVAAGGSGGGSVLNVTAHVEIDGNSMALVLDYTAGEIMEAFQTGLVIITMDYEEMFGNMGEGDGGLRSSGPSGFPIVYSAVTCARYYPGQGYAFFALLEGNISGFLAETENDYPIIYDGGGSSDGGGIEETAV